MKSDSVEGRAPDFAELDPTDGNVNTSTREGREGRQPRSEVKLNRSHFFGNMPKLRFGVWRQVLSHLCPEKKTPHTIPEPTTQVASNAHLANPDAALAINPEALRAIERELMAWMLGDKGPDRVEARVRIAEKIRDCAISRDPTLDLSVVFRDSMLEPSTGDDAVSTLPPCIAALTHLNVLDISGHDLQALPDWLRNLTALTQLNVSHNQLQFLPPWLDHLTELRDINVYGNQLIALPDAIGALSKLVSINVGGNRLSHLPPSMANLTELRFLSIVDNQFWVLPMAIRSLEKLVNLDVAGNQIIALPEWIGQLYNLQRLHFADNRLIKLPETLVGLTSLRHLYLNDNQIKSLPKSMAHFQWKKPGSINLAGNPLPEHALMDLRRALRQGNPDGLKVVW